MSEFTPLPYFRAFCQLVIPLVYDDSLSYYEVLCKVIDYFNKLTESINSLGTSVNNNRKDIDALKKEMKIVQEELDKIANGEYISQYIEQLAKWIDANLQQLVGRIVKYIFFGLTDDGYFVAYIPPTWDFLEFDTVIDTASPLYGHLLLRW